MNIEGDDRAVDRPAPSEPVAVGDAPGSVVCRLEGALDLDTVDAARVLLNEALASPAPVLVVDLAAVTFCDSSGLNLLLQTRLTGQSAGKVLRLAAVPDQVMRLLELTGATEVFPRCATVADALHSL
ncbi:metal ABC transporter substrate-binding protein [Streptomyces tateyamensis]|uniref:Anti-sigma factor antagonist n=1 Tax=Streptomyces tateyamensis TaxID=565073 RepID=A0A2V4P9B6_9ACTN|nr:STAS domain-containing protein [Streptomyces tateyamensis]PYC79982.1 metal ABC transporter substrate-binding protein [Streptomyces tateyamensis]